MTLYLNGSKENYWHNDVNCKHQNSFALLLCSSITCEPSVGL